MSGHEKRLAYVTSDPPEVTRAEAIAQVEGPWRFDLMRPCDYLVGRKPAVVAQGVVFSDGTIALRWRSAHRSTAVYGSREDFAAIHVTDHEGTSIRWIDPEPTAAFCRGSSECTQDSYENCPFASIGGLDQRRSPKVPEYITTEDEPEWLRGYLRAAQAQYGDDWRSCSFGWAPAITIGGAEVSS